MPKQYVKAAPRRNAKAATRKVKITTKQDSETVVKQDVETAPRRNSGVEEAGKYVNAAAKQDLKAAPTQES